MMNQIGDTESESLTPFTTSLGGVDIVRRRTTQYITAWVSMRNYRFMCVQNNTVHCVCITHANTLNCAGSDVLLGPLQNYCAFVSHLFHAQYDVAYVFRIGDVIVL